MACVAATWLLIRHTSTGRQLYAFGDNPEGARRLGINIAAMHFIAFGWLGLMAGIAGLVQVHYAQEVVPNALSGRELDVLAAVVLGGARLGGGRGTVLGCCSASSGRGDAERAQPARHLALRLQDDRRRIILVAITLSNEASESSSGPGAARQCGRGQRNDHPDPPTRRGARPEPPARCRNHRSAGVAAVRLHRFRRDVRQIPERHHLHFGRLPAAGAWPARRWPC